MQEVTLDEAGRQLKGLGQQGQEVVYAYLKQQESKAANLQAAFEALTAKLDLDAGVTDTDYNTLNP